MFFVYILQSETSQRFYIGQSRDLHSRVEYHNRYGSPATRRRGPWKLVYWEEFETRREAVRRERELKRMKSRSYLQDLVSPSL